MADGKSSLTKARETIERLSNKTKAYKDKATEGMRELVTTGETVAASYAAGFADEVWGTEQANGVRRHMTGDAPTIMLASGAGKVAGLFGLFGDFTRDAYAIANGGLSHWSSDEGRASGKAFREKRAAAPTAKPAAKPAAGGKKAA